MNTHDLNVINNIFFNSNILAISYLVSVADIFKRNHSFIEKYGYHTHSSRTQNRFKEIDLNRKCQFRNGGSFIITCTVP